MPRWLRIWRKTERPDFRKLVELTSLEVIVEFHSANLGRIQATVMEDARARIAQLRSELNGA